MCVATPLLTTPATPEIDRAFHGHEGDHEQDHDREQLVEHEHAITIGFEAHDLRDPVRPTMLHVLDFLRTAPSASELLDRRREIIRRTFK